MKIGKETVPRTAISTSDEHAISVRGADLCRDLIGQISFTDYFHLLVTGRRASADSVAVLDATLVAIAEHGLVPSVQASRMTLAAAPDALQGAVAAGILGCGSVILGASETAGLMFTEIAAQADADGGLDGAAERVVRSYRVDDRPELTRCDHSILTHPCRLPEGALVCGYLCGSGVLGRSFPALRR